MRDFRTVTAREVVAESIEMKVRWLARQLRLTDTTADIELWVKAITLLENLLLRLQEGCKLKLFHWQDMEHNRGKERVSPYQHPSEQISKIVNSAMTTWLALQHRQKLEYQSANWNRIKEQKRKSTVEKRKGGRRVH